MFHSLEDNLLQDCELPSHFTNPFDYRPHQLVIEAKEILCRNLQQHKEWQEEISRGKMFGILVVRNNMGKIGFIAAFSGNIANQTQHKGFVPPIFDLKAKDSFFNNEEMDISSINREIEELQNNSDYLELIKEKCALQEQATVHINNYRTQIRQAKEQRKKERESYCSAERNSQLNRESQHQKAELKRIESRYTINIGILDNKISAHSEKINYLQKRRKQLSIELQRKIFDHYNILNHRGDSITLTELFATYGATLPPAGAGECAAPKLLQYAFQNGFEIIAMGEFWQGKSPKGEVRHHDCFYPACTSKCRPILGYMLKGLKLDESTLAPNITRPTKIVYRDKWLAVVDKPSGLLSVKGTAELPSIEELLPEIFPDQPQSKVAHRLDMDTSGLLIIAFTTEVYVKLQAQFANRTIKKRYVAIIDGVIYDNAGEVNLPISPNLDDLPRQMVDHTHGKESTTHYEVVAKNQHTTRINLYPLTGRTHQLRVHCSHYEGLNAPIIGDRLYGKEPQERLLLHAEEVVFQHPITDKQIRVESKAEF